MVRMRFKNAYNYDSAARQVDTGDFDYILDETTDIGYAFAQVVDAAIAAGLEDFSENFIAENDLLTEAQADALYELVGAVLAHVAELDPHTQYVQASELSGLLGDYSTTLEADALYEAIGAAASAVAAHEAASDPHTQYLTETEADALYEPVGGGGGGAVATHEAASDPHSQYLTAAEGDAAYDAINAASSAVTAHEAASDPHAGYLTETEADAAYDAINAASSAVTAHEAASDPHTQYLTETEADALYEPVGGGGGGFPTRTTASKTTASLAANAEEVGTLALAAGFRLYTLTVDRACRIRLYTTSAKRTADEDRNIGTVPVGDHGLIFEYVATGAFTDLDLSPVVDGFCPSGTDVYYAIENRTTGTSTVAVTFGYLRSE